MRIVWSDSAKSQLKEIYEYYYEVAGIKVAQKIKNDLIKKPRQLSLYPQMGQLEDNPLVLERGLRYLVEGNYKIVYLVLALEKTILISVVFDTIQNPSKLKR